jgi:pachytene checkpoint protein 2
MIPGEIIHVEIAVPESCPTILSEIQSDWEGILSNGEMATWKEIHNPQNWANVPSSLKVSTKKISITTDQGLVQDSEMVDLLHVRPNFYCFVLHEEEPSLEVLDPTHDGDDLVPACENRMLPHIDLDGLWESLIFTSSIKKSLLYYAHSALLFSDLGVSNHVINRNRLILLYGPPGTGKTSLCRALAQKLAIRLSHRFQAAHLLEVQSHSLFSKWFSTSGKLIHRLFELVKDMVQDNPHVLICVLLDEVESLAASRSQLGGDPTDSMRAVNALLTGLDRLQVFPNLLILATTNMAAKVDDAFCDRADLILEIGHPIPNARLQILLSCINELQRVGLLQSSERVKDDRQLLKLLDNLVIFTGGWSGRGLRRLPLRAHALHMASFGPSKRVLSVKEFITTMLLTAQKQDMGPL